MLNSAQNTLTLNAVTLFLEVIYSLRLHLHKDMDSFLLASHDIAWAIVFSSADGQDLLQGVWILPDFTRRYLTRTEQVSKADGEPGELQSAQRMAQFLHHGLDEIGWAKLSHVPIGTASQWPQILRWRSRYRKITKLSNLPQLRSWHPQACPTGPPVHLPCRFLYLESFSHLSIFDFQTCWGPFNSFQLLPKQLGKGLFPNLIV